ncbi:beta-1,4-galactosyltransferase 6-like [Diadema antillarum]|uniref:beta-1,4-galactosyltransferase 6-like n=1 Tax=Diadema antillarum TaxID=105358 RepID=UPI003A89B300
MFPLKQFSKHRKVLLVLLVVVIVFSLQLTFFGAAPTNRNHVHTLLNKNFQWTHGHLDGKQAINASTLKQMIERNITKLDTPNYRFTELKPVHVLPNLTQIFKPKVAYRRESSAHLCELPTPSLQKRIKYVANISYSNLAYSEKTVFKNLTERVRRLTEEANHVVREILTRKRSLASDDLEPDEAEETNEAEKKKSERIGAAESSLSMEVGTHLYLPGGHWIPISCKPKWKVAIIIPFRQRFESLHILLRNLVPFLLHQKLEFGIFVAEQGFSEVMNRGLMRNIGYQLAKHEGTEWDCYIFHDVDYVPMNITNYYGCDGFPKHYATHLEEFEFSNPFLVDFGGVVGISKEQMDRTNGYSNMYWGWGGEDDDIAKRLKHHRYNVSRSPEGYYRDLPHKKKGKKELCRERFCLNDRAVSRIHLDGLSAIRYPMDTSVELSALYTNISVDERTDD